MDSSTIEKLEEVMRNRTEKLNSLEQGTAEFKTEVNGIEQIGRLILDHDKVEYDKSKAEDEMMTEEHRIEAEEKSSKKTKIIDTGLRILEVVVLPLVGYGVYSWLHFKDLEFEKDDTISLPTSREHRKALRFGKKL